MKTKSYFLGALLAAFLFNVTAAAERVWRYQLLEGSTFQDDCNICGRPTIIVPMRGSFLLRLIEEGPRGSRYAVENLVFKASDDGGSEVNATGEYRVGGDFAITQDMSLSGYVANNLQLKEASFASQSVVITRRQPMIAITMVQTNGTPTSTITLEIKAAPFQEIWFSTDSSFHTATKPEDNLVRSGDLLSMNGHIVKTSVELQGRFPGPTYEDIGLDAVGLLPGAELAFSGHTLGVLLDGDFAFVRGRAITHLRDLPFPFSEAPEGTGLDGLQFLSPSRFYISTKGDLPPSISHGDIILIDMEQGSTETFRAQSTLLERFHAAVAKDNGVDAFYVWPHGEIWFSTSDGFDDKELGPIGPGDLLSDQGYIVYRNLEIVGNFQPIEDAASFGLDALTIITDADAYETETAKFSAVFDPENQNVQLSWKGGGRVFQVERATDIAGPWNPISNILSDLQYIDLRPTDISSQAYYRLRQW
jgi:hypothetical protein